MTESFAEIATKTAASLSEKGITRKGTVIDVGQNNSPSEKVKEEGSVSDTKVENVDVPAKDNTDSKDVKESSGTKQEDKADKKGTFNHKISQMTARIKASEAKAAQLEKELNEERERNNNQNSLNEIKKLILSKDKDSDDYEEGTSDSNNEKPVSLEDIQKMLDERDNKIKESLEKEKTISRVDKLNNEFSELIKKDYEKDYDANIDALTDEAQEQVDQLVALYKSNPEYWLEKIKEVGARSYADRLSGNFKPEKTAKEIEEASKSLEMEGNSISLTKEEVSSNKFSDIAKSVSEKLAKSGITRK